MKKLVFMLLAAVFFVSAHAQLAHTKWKGAIKGDNPQTAVFKFGRDTVVLYGADGEVLETMTYKITGSVFTVIKVSGQSDCDTVVPGKYKFEIQAGAMSLTLVLDKCGDRSSALDATKWLKVKG